MRGDRPMTDVSVRAIVENRGVDVEFAVAAGEVLAVLGPNGAGKSTALHVIAGLVQPDTGVVRVGDRVLTDTSRRKHVATHDRRVGLLLQDPLLFPHLSVAANVAFSPRSSRADAARWLAEVEATELADRMPRATLRWAGTAGRTGSCVGCRTGCVAPRRADGRPGRGRRRRDAQTAAPRAGPRRPVGGVDHPRPGRRADPGRSGADSGIRPNRRNRFHRSCFGCTAQPVRGAFRRREPGHRHRRRRGRADDSSGGPSGTASPDRIRSRAVRRWRCSHRRRSRCIGTDRTAAPATPSR